MCRSCYAEEMRSPDGRRRQQILQQAARARAANVAKAARRRAQADQPGDLMNASMDHLWFEAEKVLEFIRAEAGETARTELSKSDRMAARWDAWRGRPWLRFDQVDELLCVLGLWVGDLGEPIYSGSASRYPVLEAV